MSVSRERSILTGRALVFFLALSLLAPGCKSSRESAMNPPPRPLSAVLAEHAPRLMTMEGVVAVAEGENAAGRPCLKIWATGADRVRKRLPPAIDGYDVVVEESGPIEAMDSSAKAGR
jgi:hypothetical protein